MKCFGIKSCPLSVATPETCPHAQWLYDDIVRCGYRAKSEVVINEDEGGCFTC